MERFHLPSLFVRIVYSYIIISDDLIDIRRGLIDNWWTGWNEFLCYSAAPGFLRNRRTENDQSLTLFLIYISIWLVLLLLLHKSFSFNERIIMKNNAFCCVFNRSDETILLEHILHHHHPTITLRSVKIASSYRITYLCWIICYRG